MVNERPAVRSTLRERRRFSARNELVDAVLAVISDEGVDAATIDRISLESGVSRGTVYAYFPMGRVELLGAAYAVLGRRLVERTVSAVGEQANWRSRLTAHAHEMFTLAGDANIGFFYNVSGPALIPDGAERGIGSGASVVMIKDDLSLAQEAGEISPALDAEITAVLLVGALREAAVLIASSDGQQQSQLRDRAFACFDSLVRALPSTGAQQPACDKAVV